MYAAIASDYIAWDPCPETRDYVEKLLARSTATTSTLSDFEESNAELEKLLGKRLAFGTAGLRGPMGPGYSRMNDLVILQTMQGLTYYLMNTCMEQGQDAREKGVVIGYDHRQCGSLSSRHFAEICVAVLLKQNFRVLFLEGFVPTPFVPFGVTHYNCAAGIMITASHNPKEDNGFKVYWGNGAQIIPPHDAGIAEAITDNLEPWPLLNTSPESFQLDHNFREVTDELAKSYFTSMSRVSIPSPPLASPLRIAYTAMHGVGAQWIKKAFDYVQEINNLDPVLYVPSQRSPDPTFPTVKFPNPEEKGALDEAMRFASETDCHLIIANDPDADRLAAAERRCSASGSYTWRLFTGNEIGILLGHYQIQNYKEALRKNSVFKSSLVRPAAVITTVVSSGMLKKIAREEGVTYADTLTGFKWIGNESIRLQEKGFQVLFSYEEALGYCVGDALTDKDGISAAIAFSELANQLHARGVSLSQQLESISLKYGLFVSFNTYVFSYDNTVTDAIFHRLRTSGAAGGYITQVNSSTVTRIRDITVGYDSATVDKKSELPLTPESHMIMYEFDNNCSIILRTSGTEPKIKCYSEISSGTSCDGDGCVKEDQTETGLKTALVDFVEECIALLLQPHANKLIRV